MYFLNEGNASPSPALNSTVSFTHLGGERYCDIIKCLAQEHNAMSTVRYRTHTIGYEDERTE